MTSQRWSKLISVLVFSLVLATAGSAQAQWGYPLGYGSYGAGGYGGAGNFIGFPMYGYAQSLGQVPQTTASYGLGYGGDPGYSGFGYGSYGAGGYGGAGNFIGFPMYGYAQSLGQVPQTATSFSSVSGAATLVPGWGGSGYGAYHRPRARTVVPRRANPR
jgi:hypothetical protein